MNFTYDESGKFALTGDLPSLTSASWLFYGASTLTSFTSDMPSLKNGSNMFSGCSNLTAFNGNMPSLTNGSGMFNSCKKLTSFYSDLPCLTSASTMFGTSTSNCTKLDLASVQNIATTINDLASQGKTGSVSIGMAQSIQGNTELDAALATIRSKGWTVTEVYA